MKNYFYHMIQTISFFKLARKCGEKSDYLLFSDNMFLLGLEHKDKIAGVQSWGSEQLFLDDLLSKKNHCISLFSDYIFLLGHDCGEGSHMIQMIEFFILAILA